MNGKTREQQFPSIPWEAAEPVTDARYEEMCEELERAGLERDHSNTWSVPAYRVTRTPDDRESVWVLFSDDDSPLVVASDEDEVERSGGESGNRVVFASTHVPELLAKAWEYAAFCEPRTFTVRVRVETSYEDVTLEAYDADGAREAALEYVAEERGDDNWANYSVKRTEEVR